MEKLGDKDDNDNTIVSQVQLNDTSKNKLEVEGCDSEKVKTEPGEFNEDQKALLDKI